MADTPQHGSGGSQAQVAPPSEAPAPAPKPDRPERESHPESVVIRSYPKAVFFYPAAIVALICGILQLTTGVAPQTLGFVFMCVFLFNLVVIAFEFTRYVSVAVALTALVFVLLGVQLNDKFHIIDALARAYSALNFQASPAFYFGIFGCFVLTFVGIAVDTRFDYYELRGNEVLHHHGFLGDVERSPAQSLKIKKEINDVFEYMLLFSGRLIIDRGSGERPIVLENVPRINVIEELITQKLHTIKVSVHTD